MSRLVIRLQGGNAAVRDQDVLHKPRLEKSTSLADAPPSPRLLGSRSSPQSVCFGMKKPGAVSRLFHSRRESMLSEPDPKLNLNIFAVMTGLLFSGRP